MSIYNGHTTQLIECEILNIDPKFAINQKEFYSYSLIIMEYQMSKEVLIVGGGLAGLSAALKLESLNWNVTLLEKSNRLGGRLKTDKIDGFLCDRGFHVIQSRYSHFKELNLIESLGLSYFDSIAVSHDLMGNQQVWTNPLKHPSTFLKSLNINSLKEMTQLGRLAVSCYLKNSEGVSLDEIIQKLQLPDSLVDQFLKPFFGSVFCNKNLEVRSDLFLSIFYDFLLGKAGLAKEGIEMIPKVLEKRLEKTRIIRNCRVDTINGHTVKTNIGEYQADVILLALDEPSLNKLCGKTKRRTSQSISVLYYAIESNRLPNDKRIHLVSHSNICNITFLNHVQSSYAPKGYDLISCCCFGSIQSNENKYINHCLNVLAKIFSLNKSDLDLIKYYSIKHALPNQGSVYPTQSYWLSENLIHCSENLGPSTFNEALFRGQNAALKIDQKLNFA